MLTQLRNVGLAASLTLPLLLAGATRADDWPQWRGPNRDGVWNETGILESFPPAGLKVLWRAPVGWGYSSPVVARGRVFLTDSQLMRPKSEERVHCFDEATGTPLWTYSYDASYRDWAFTVNNEGRPTSTPVVNSGKIYTLGMVGRLCCLDVVKGAVCWEKDLGKEYGAVSCNASPLVESDLLILVVGGKPGACVVAFDKHSGKAVWKALDDTATHSSPVAITAGGKRQLIVWTNEAVTSLDPATGKTYWRVQLLATADYVVSTPAFHDDLLLIGGLMLKLDPEKPGATVLWPNTKAVARRILSNTSTALLRGGCVFSAKSSGELVCLEARTGKQLWETDKVTDKRNGASIHLTRNGDFVFLYTDRGELIRAQLTEKGYKEICRARLLEPTYPFAGRKVAWPPPVYANRHVFARNDKELVCVSLAAKQ